MDRINNINETGGAGDEGTDELVQKLQQDTPGQPTKRKPKMKKFRDILEGVDPIQENVNKESKLLAKEINDAARRESGGDKKDFQTVAKLIGAGKLKDAAKHMSKLDTVVLEDLVTFVMGHESVFKAMYPKAKDGQYVAQFARKVESVEEQKNCGCGKTPCETYGEVKEANFEVHIKGGGVAHVKAKDKDEAIAKAFKLRRVDPKMAKDKTFMKGVGVYAEQIEEAMSPADKAKRLKMIKQAVEKMNKSNMEKAKKDALKMMKDSGMFDEELEEAKGAPKIKGLNIYGSEINGLRQGLSYYSAKPVDMRGKLMFKVTDEFGSFETIDLKTFAKRFG